MSKSEKKRERFGRYLILDHLVDGGMAKICRARFLGKQADKVVAIKMVQPKYSKDESFKTMFMDEIKLTFPLIHPNIIQTYDYGIHKGQLFVAMEYCDGRNLKEYLDKLKMRKFVFPVEISVYITTQICQGLHYAHTYTDRLTGKSANIIHRDISPHNIMLTYDGAIKIIDFGIAKADSNSEATQAGTIKGKLSYLAPEYLEDEKLDATYDEFAVGITLWEMLCSRKLFKASNDLAVLKKVQECKIPPPSSINPNVPKELDEIVLKALSKDRSKRYDELDKLNRALMKFLYANYPDFNGTDLSYFAKELFKEEIKKDREKMFEFGKIDLTPYLKDLSEGSNGDTSESSEDTDQVDNPKKKEARVLDFGFEEPTVVAKKKKNYKNSKSDLDKKFSHLKKDGKAPEEVEIKLDDGGLTRTKNKKPDIIKKKAVKKTTMKSRERPKSATVMIGVKTNKASLLEEGEHSSKIGHKAKKFILDKSHKDIRSIAAAIAVATGVIFYGYGLIFKKVTEDNIASTTNIKHNRGPAEVDLAEKADTFATIQFVGLDRSWQKVFINGKSETVGILGDLTVRSNEKIVLRVQQSGREHHVETLLLKENEIIQLQIPDKSVANYSYLVTSRDCVLGKLTFTLFGEEREEQLPIPKGTGIPFPLKLDKSGTSIPQVYKAVYLRPDGISKNIEIKVENEDKSVDLCENEKI